MDRVHEKFFNESFLAQALLTPEILREDKEWLLHATPYITAIACKDLDFNISSMRKVLSEDKEYIVNGNKVSSNTIRLIFKIFEEHNRSDYCNKSPTQVQRTATSAAVPWVLYAFKLHYNVPYSKWSFDDADMIPRVLGKGLRNYFQAKDAFETCNDEIEVISSEAGEVGESEYFDSLGLATFDKKRYYPFDLEQRATWRYQALKMGTVKDTTNVLALPFKGNHRLSASSVGGTIFWHMLLQTWIFAPSVRSPNMITSFDDMDELDKPLAPATVDEIWKLQTPSHQSPSTKVAW